MWSAPFLTNTCDNYYMYPHSYLDIRGKLETEVSQVTGEINPPRLSLRCSLKLRKRIGKWKHYLPNIPSEGEAGLHADAGPQNTLCPSKAERTAVIHKLFVKWPKNTGLHFTNGGPCQPATSLAKLCPPSVTERSHEVKSLTFTGGGVTGGAGRDHKVGGLNIWITESKGGG